MPRINLLPPDGSIDPVMLQNRLRELQDCYLIPGKPIGIQSRLGLTSFVDLGETTPVNGVYAWNDKGVLIANCNGKVWKVTDSSGTKTQLTGSTALLSNSRVSYEEALNGSDLLLLMANGSNIVHTDNSALTTMADTDAPTTVFDLGFMGNIVVAWGSGPSWQFANPDAPLTWDASDSYDAQLSSDAMRGMSVVNGRMLLLGSKITETWYYSGTAGDPFALAGNDMVHGMGMSTSRAFTSVKGSLVFLGSDNNVWQLTEGRLENISANFTRYFDQLTGTGSAFCFHLTIKNRTFVVFTFPGDDVSYVYDPLFKVWYKWGYWDSNGVYTKFKAGTYAYMEAWDLHIVGDASTGKLYKISGQTDDSAAIRTRILTGELSWNEEGSIKKSYGLVSNLKRGEGKESNKYQVPYLKFRFRDDGRPNWSVWMDVDLGAIGDTRSITHFIRGRGGRYKTREYEIISPDDVDLVMAGLYEQVELEQRIG